MNTECASQAKLVDQLLNAPKPVDREWAAGSLGSSLPYCSDPATIEPLIRALDDLDPGVRATAAHSLGTVTNITKATDLARQAKGRLLAMLRDEDEVAIACAIYALGQLGDDSVAPELLPFLDYPNLSRANIWETAIEALRDLHYAPAIPHLKRLLVNVGPDNPRPGIWNDAIAALFSMWRLSDEVEDTLRTIANNPDAPLHTRAQMMLEIIAEQKQSGSLPG